MSAETQEVSCVNPFRSVKFFVVCQSFLQLTQLMTSGYMKGSVSTIEKRFGFSSQTSGLVASFNEVGNTLLIVFVSYFGSRVHRPRVIGCGAILVSIAAFIISLPQFILDIYEFDRSVSGKSNSTDICVPGQLSLPETEQCTPQKASESQVALFLLLLGQALLGIGAVPIQPFGISYIDDFASKSNSPLYVGIIFAATTLGPAIAFVLMSVMLRIYVDVDKVPTAEIQLTSNDPRWVGAWWLGFIFTSTLAAVAAIPFFFFPRMMLKEEEDPQKVVEESSKSLPVEEQKRRPEDLQLSEFIRMFPAVLFRNLKNPFFLIVILALINVSAMIAGLGVFLGKFMEAQFSLTAPYANMLIGAVNLPAGMLGVLLGGVIMKKFHLSLKQSTLLCVVSMGLCVLFEIPLFFLGCPTQAVAGLNTSQSSRLGEGQISDCNHMCNCSDTAFNPICGEDKIEYISPCYAGCLTLHYDVSRMKVSNYSSCSCIKVNGSAGSAVPGTCSTSCSKFLTPFVALVCIAGFLACVIHTPSFMLILRSVKAEDKSFAIGIQFLLLRIAAWLPAPVLNGSLIDSTCILWQSKCRKRAACRYYNNTALRHSFIGIQVWFQVCCFLCLVAVYYLYHREEQVQPRSTEENLPDTVLEQMPEASS
ncbi:solute carrier organic anion transporter family member 2B1 isoform X2 [Paroedura picta]|uniref:solute carrier organic anion transporter family member 2B1 isoform X2 n=1 Tax=Paroedura picta TaxID=143630 RepID=UPI0040561F51